MRIAHLDWIRATHPRIAEAFDSLKNSIDNIALKTKVDSAGSQLAAPPQIGSLSVTGADGVFDAVISDNATIDKAINYFLEYAIDANFTRPHVISLGPARTWRGFFGNQTLFWRAYSQYIGSPASTPLNFGAPTSVVGGGALNGPAIQASTGSGTAANNGWQGGSGFGPVDTRVNAS